MVEDISQKTIVVLVILTLMVSVVGTWTVMDQLWRVQPAKSVSGTTSGKVTLNVAHPRLPAEDAGNGHVNLVIS